MKIKLPNKKDLDLTITDFEPEMNDQLEELEKKSGNASFCCGIYFNKIIFF